MGSWEEIVDYVVPSNTTSVTLNNFGTITKDDFIKIHTTIINPTSSLCHVRLFANNNNSTTDYYTQRLTGEDNSVISSRFNSQSPRLCFIDPNTTSSTFAV